MAPRGDSPKPDASPAGFDATALHRTIDSLARPRMTGSAGARDAEARIRRRFRALGYDAEELPFSFSTLPGRYGLPFAGAVLLATTAAGWLLAPDRPATAIGVLVAGLVLAVLPLLLLDPAIRRLPWGRVETANLLFTRSTPRWIVMAHRDTKSQLAPTLVRTLALAAAAVGWAALTAVAVAGLAAGAVPASGAGWAAGAAVALGGGAVVLLLSPAANRSPGALDNASGLAALLALAERTPADVAFLVTDGEELGLAGARAVPVRLPEVDGVVNLDGLDDGGPIRIAEGRGGGRRGPASPVAAALLEEARSMGLAAVRRPLPPFVMVDHEPLARAGLPAVTVLKGRWRSLLRVHRPADSADRLTGAGAAEVAALVLTVLRRPEGTEPDTLRPGERSGHSPAP